VPCTAAPGQSCPPGPAPAALPPGQPHEHAAGEGTESPGIVHIDKKVRTCRGIQECHCRSCVLSSTWNAYK
jgi:hypothetical protein